MLRWLIVIAVVGVIGAVVWNLATGKESLAWGFSSGAPLGDTAKVEGYLGSKGLKREPADPEGLRLFFGEAFPDKSAVTAEEWNDAVPGMKHLIVVVKGKDGRIRGIAGRFRSGAKVFSLTGTKCEHATALIWLQINGGKEPEFRELNEGGADARAYWLATTEKNGVSCSWRKDGAGGIMQHAHEIVDTVSFVVR